MCGVYGPQIKPPAWRCNSVRVGVSCARGSAASRGTGPVCSAVRPGAFRGLSGTLSVTVMLDLSLCCSVDPGRWSEVLEIKVRSVLDTDFVRTTPVKSWAFQCSLREEPQTQNTYFFFFLASSATKLLSEGLYSRVKTCSIVSYTVSTCGCKVFD